MIRIVKGSSEEIPLPIRNHPFISHQASSTSYRSQVLIKVAITPSQCTIPRRLVSARKPLLLLALLGLANRRHILPGRIVRCRDLVERVVGVLLELLPDLLDLLVAPEALLVLHLLEAALLVRCKRRLEAALWVAVQLLAVLGREAERVERIVDTRRVERRWLAVEGAQRAVDAARLLLRLLCTCTLGLGGERGFFGSQESVLLGLLARGFGGLFGGGLAVTRSVPVFGKMKECHIRFGVRLGALVPLRGLSCLDFLVLGCLLRGCSVGLAGLALSLLGVFAGGAALLCHVAVACGGKPGARVCGVWRT